MNRTDPLAYAAAQLGPNRLSQGRVRRAESTQMGSGGLWVGPDDLRALALVAPRIIASASDAAVSRGGDRVHALVIRFGKRPENQARKVSGSEARNFAAVMARVRMAQKRQVGCATPRERVQGVSRYSPQVCQTPTPSVPDAYTPHRGLLGDAMKGERDGRASLSFRLTVGVRGAHAHARSDRSIEAAGPGYGWGPAPRRGVPGPQPRRVFGNKHPPHRRPIFRFRACTAVYPTGATRQNGQRRAK
jgi:hypothetical protein